MSIDIGQTNTGVALCDNSETLAFPFCVLKEKNKNKLIEKITNLVLENNVNKVIVGLPLNMNGSVGPNALESIKFKQKLYTYVNSKNIINKNDFEIILWDERLSTVYAQKRMNECGKCVKNSKKNIDSVAATVILQNFLDRYHKN